MHHMVGSLPARRARFVLSLAVLCVLAAAVSGCKDIDEPNTEKADAPVTTGTVQATMTPEGVAGQMGATMPQSADAPKGEWPDKVGQFAAAFKAPVWYPTKLPAGMEIESVDVVEIEPGTGLVCDVLFFDGTNAVAFTQGSAVAREYEIESVATVSWGTKTATVVRQDPADPQSPQMIVLVDGKNFVELSGNLPITELEAIAASMVLVE